MLRIGFTGSRNPGDLRRFHFTGSQPASTAVHYDQSLAELATTHNDVTKAFNIALPQTEREQRNSASRFMTRVSGSPREPLTNFKLRLATPLAPKAANLD